MRDDFDDDGVLNQSNSADYTDNDEFSGSDGITFQNANRQSFRSDNTGVVCFAHDTMILTANGERPAGLLRPGDLIVMRDNGVQPLVMLASRKLDAAELSSAPNLKPILIEQGLVGQTAPTSILFLKSFKSLSPMVPRARVFIPGRWRSRRLHRK